MQHYPIDHLTPTQQANLARLAHYLETHVEPPDFCMLVFTEDNSLPENYNCGTVACAAGYGPAAGILPLPGELWPDYTSRVFTGEIRAYSSHDDPKRLAFRWCFSSDWASIDNTPTGAAKRIKYMLKHGIPEDLYAQMLGNAPLSYQTSTEME